MLLLVEEELMVAELQEILGLPQSRISTSLAQLKGESLVNDRRVGKNIFYSAAEDLAPSIDAVLREAGDELKEASGDHARLAFTLRKRKDRAATATFTAAGSAPPKSGVFRSLRNSTPAQPRSRARSASIA